MYATNNAISAYQRVGVETGVESADPHKLILMLFEGAQEALARSKMHINHNEIAEMMHISVGTSKSQLSRAKEILRNQIQQKLGTY